MRSSHRGLVGNSRPVEAQACDKAQHRRLFGASGRSGRVRCVESVRAQGENAVGFADMAGLQVEISSGWTRQPGCPPCNGSSNNRSRMRRRDVGVGTL